MNNKRHRDYCAQLEKFLSRNMAYDFENEDEAIQAFIKQYNQQIKPFFIEDCQTKIEPIVSLKRIAYAQNEWKEYQANS